MRLYPIPLANLQQWMPTAAASQTALLLFGRFAEAKPSPFVDFSFPVADIPDAVVCRVLSTPPPICRMHLLRARMPLQ